ncbi:MAG: DUF5666 domain-containing protein [Pseudomonadota bacterium]
MSAVDRRGFLARALGLTLGATLAGCAVEDDFAARKPRKPREGGIGGTGIIGVLTEFGSLIVNGRRILLDDTTEVSDAFGARPASALALGQSLTLEAATVDGALVARSVHITHPLIGRIEAVSDDGRSLRIMGVTVRLEPGVALADALGRRVAVSGLWDGQAVVASRLDPVADGTADVVSGTFSVGPDGPVVQAVPVAEGAGPLPDTGVFVTAIGRYESGRFEAASLAVGRFFGAAGPLEELSVEGYLEPIDTDPGFSLSGLGHSFDPAARLAALADGRALFEGPYTGDFAVGRALPLPEGAAARRAALPVGLDLATAPGTLSTR